MSTVILSGNKDFNIKTSKDLDFDNFVKKINILNMSGITYEFLRDNFGDYWLIHVEIEDTIKNPVVIIPSFIEGIMQRDQAVIFNSFGHSELIKIYGGNRFYGANWEIYYKTLGLPGLITYNNIYGNIQIIGPGKPLKGIGHKLFQLVRQNSISFKGLNLSQFQSLNEFFQDSLIKYIDLSGINFGKPKHMHRFFGNSAVTEVDLSTIDFSECERISQMFFGCDMLERVKWGGRSLPDNLIAYDLFLGCDQLKIYKSSDIKFGKNTRLDGMFVECENLEELDLQSITKDIIHTSTKLYDIIRYLPRLKTLKLNKDLIRGLADNEEQLNKSIQNRTSQANLKIVYIG